MTTAYYVIFISLTLLFSKQNLRLEDFKAAFWNLTRYYTISKRRKEIREIMPIKIYF